MDGLTQDDDLLAWCQKNHLSEETYHVLRQEGFTSLQFLRLLTAEEVDKSLKQPRLLPLAQSLALQHALVSLKTEQDCQEEPMETPGSPLTTHHPDTHQLAHLTSRTQQPQHHHLPQQRCQQQHEEQHLGSGDQASAAAVSTVVRNSAAAADRSASWELVEDTHYRFLLVGKTGSGKSVTGNSILGAELFDEDVAFNSQSNMSQLKRGIVNGKWIEIMDSPGLFDTQRTHEEISVDIVKAVACMHPGPHAILYVIRLGRYTEEEYEVYTRLKALFDEDVTRHVIVVFTGGDSLEKEGKSIGEVLQRVPTSLQKVLHECQHRVVVFNNVADDRQPYVQQLLRVVEQLLRSNGGGYYTCPRYAEVGKGMEEEVQHRLQEMEKEQLAHKPYVQELKRKALSAEEELQKERQLMEQREQERQLEAKAMEERAEAELQSLLEDMKKKDLSLQQQQEERERLLERHAREREEVSREMERRREQDKREMERKEREVQLAVRKAEEEQRKFLEAKKRVYERKMAEMKERIVKDQEDGFLDRFLGKIKNILGTVASVLPAVTQIFTGKKE